MQAFTTLTAKTLVVPTDNIDTDQIIPARFLTTTKRAGLGRYAFFDWRFLEDGTRKNSSPFPEPGADARTILVGGANFGCGSSREHAPWSLLDYGFRAVISSDIADIFKSNSLKNGLLPIEVPEEVHQHLLKNPGMELSIDLEANILTLADGIEVRFETEPFSRRCMLDGVDPLGYLLGQGGAIASYEEARA